MRIRIKFRKYGTMKFIGHLDVMRYFQKAIRRADVPIRYSEGFSPHQIMSFAAPLGVGITSNSEYVDIDLTILDGNSRTMMERLNAVMSEGFEVVEYRLLPEDSANAMSMVAAADYSIMFRPGYEPADVSQEQWFEEIRAFFDRPHIEVTKKTKRGETRIDLKPLVYEMRLAAVDRESGLPLKQGEASGAESIPALFMKISTGSSANIKPELLLDAFYGSRELERPAFAYMVQREEVYGDMASDEEKEKGIHHFKPLGDFGQDIE